VLFDWQAVFLTRNFHDKNFRGQNLDSYLLDFVGPHAPWGVPPIACEGLNALFTPFLAPDTSIPRFSNEGGKKAL